MAVQQAMTLERFLAWESRQELKHEYYRGEVRLHNVATPGGSTSHNRIETSLVYVLQDAFRRTECEVFTSNQTVTNVDGDIGFYPDATVLAEPLQKRRYGTLDAVTNPAVVFEILSKGTESYDRDHKLDAYRAIPSMREIFLVDSSARRVERYLRTEDGWSYETFTQGEFTVLGRPIALDGLYERVEL